MDMSEDFLIAYSMAYYHKEEAIKMYKQELQNNPKNIAAWGNMGLCKLQLAIEKKIKRCWRKVN